MKFLAAPAFLVTIRIATRTALACCAVLAVWAAPAAAWMVETYPDDIRAWIEANGGAEQISANGGTSRQQTCGRWAIVAAPIDRSRGPAVDADLP
jgi:hypothetical protein